MPRGWRLGLAGSATWIDDIRADLRADKVQAAIRNRTAVVFDWLMAALSYQGISDQAADTLTLTAVGFDRRPQI
jgi:hypothetical protein